MSRSDEQRIEDILEIADVPALVKALKQTS
jgi:hypothetical protein